MSSPSARAPARGRAIRLTPQTWLAVCCAVVAIALVVVQVAHLRSLLDPNQVFTAGFARGLVLGFVLAVGGIGAWTAFAPDRLLRVPFYVAAGIAGLALVATLGVGGQVWSFAVALLTLTASWQLGAWLLSALGFGRLAQLAPVAWLAGVTPLGFFVLALGRLHALEWWDVAVPVLVVGVLGAARLAGALRAGAAHRAWRTMTGSRLAVAVTALAVLTFGLASVWTAAPELMYDALYAKAWLPLEWARSGAIEPLVSHPVLNNAGFAQLIAVPGQLVSAGAVGRYLEWLVAPGIVATMWWAGKRSSWAPIAAAAVAITPHLFWQMSTADDDALLAFGVLALAVAVLRLTPREDGDLGTGLVVGLLAGTCFNLKIHLLVLAGAMALAWWALRGRFGWRALAGLAGGAFVSAAPPLILRWVDTGNPLLPAYNNIFKSPYWPPVNEHLNFPFLHDPGPLGPISVVAKAFTDTSALNDTAPVGAFGLLVGAVVVALLLGWCRGADGRGRPAIMLWVALLAATVAWYDEFRYLRYLLPAAILAVLVLLVLAPARPLPRRVQVGAIAAVVGLAALLWPVTIAQFWNVPGKDMPIEAALGFRNADDYEKATMPERDALAAFDRTAGPNATAASDAHERAWLTHGRDLEPSFELRARLQASGGVPTDPLQMLRRYRELGVTWVIITAGTPIAGDPTVQRLVQRYGQLRYADAFASVYQLRGARPTPMPGCETLVPGGPRCWQGTLDAHPGYAGAESPAGIARTIAVCPSEVVVASVDVAPGGAPVPASIIFNGHDDLARTPSIHGRVRSMSRP